MLVKGGLKIMAVTFMWTLLKKKNMFRRFLFLRGLLKNTFIYILLSPRCLNFNCSVWKDYGDGKGTAKHLLDKIADLESEAQKSFMHRSVLCSSILGLSSRFRLIFFTYVVKEIDIKFYNLQSLIHIRWSLIHWLIHVPWSPNLYSQWYISFVHEVICNFRKHFDFLKGWILPFFFCF